MGVFFKDPFADRVNRIQLIDDARPMHTLHPARFEMPLNPFPAVCLGSLPLKV
jgi:hypothetical protein